MRKFWFLLIGNSLLCLGVGIVLFSPVWVASPHFQGWLARRGWHLSVMEWSKAWPVETILSPETATRVVKLSVLANLELAGMFVYFGGLYCRHFVERRGRHVRFEENLFAE